MKLKITINGKAYDVEVDVVEQDPRPTLAGITGATGVRAVGAPVRAAGPSKNDGPEVADGKGVRSPLQGVVNSIECEPGQSVTKDQALVVLEAMKMLTTISAPEDGVVKSIFVGKGEAVKQNQVLVEFE